MRKRPVTDDEFICIWQKGESVADIAGECGTSAQSVRVRASTMRRAGVRLKRFPHGRPPRDVKRLNVIARRHAPRKSRSA